MCRHLAYLGPPVTLSDLLLAPPHSLLRQSWAPRMQRHGTVNADGFGVGWWDLGRRPEPARYRRAVPMWTDRSFDSIAGIVATTAVVAAVRSATPPAPVEESGAAPFLCGPWLFSQNGAVADWQAGVALELRATLSARRASGLEGVCDGELLFALTLDNLDRGMEPGEALSQVVRTVEGRCNLLLADGTSAFATACGDTLFVKADGAATVIASEPYDDDPAWAEVPEGSLVRATAATVSVTPL